MLLFGWLSFITGLVLAIFFREPHFYAPFSLGLVLILHSAYRRYSGKHLFANWNWNTVASYLTGLLLFSIVADRIGMAMGYWHYPEYDSLLDYSIQYAFEYVAAMLYIMLVFMIGLEFFRRRGLGGFMALVLSLVTFTIFAGLFTEFFNSYANSWVLTGMPFSNARIGRFWLVFVTLGYWILSLVPYTFYRLLDKYMVSRE